MLNARVIFRLLHARSNYRSTFLPGLVLNLHLFFVLTFVFDMQGLADM